MTLKELRAKIESSENGWYRKFEDGGHRKFKEFAERIQGRMEELKNGKDLDIKSSKEDRGLLEELVTFNNGTCKDFLEGSYIWSLGEWNDYIMNNEPFINSLQNYMKNPDDESCYNELIKNCKYKADELIERIAATCTQNVSILCNIGFKPEQFNSVVTYLETSGIIERGAVSSKGTWFAKNQALMQIMEKELGDSLDKYQRSIFVGEIWIWWTKNDGLVFGSFTDPRDGKVYKTVKIAEQTWMAENLNYDAGEGCWCYGDDEANGEKYGRLYTLNAAKAACPAGWHIPTGQEWWNLHDTVSNSEGGRDGVTLRSKGWLDDDTGTDVYGFSALPGGSRRPNGRFRKLGRFTAWWLDGAMALRRFVVQTGMEIDDDDDDNSEYGWFFGGDDDGCAISVRCIKD